jgi:hypothetical protein
MNVQEQRFEAMTVGGLLDRAFRLYGANLALFLGIVAVAYVPLSAVQIGLVALALRTGGPAAYLWIQATNIGVMLLAGLVAYPLAEGAALFAISERYLGREVRIGEAYRRARQRWWAVFDAQLCVGLRVLFGLVMLVVPGLFWMCTYAVTVPVVIVEGRRAAESMRRSRSLMAGLRGKVFLVLLVLALVQLALGLGASSLVDMVTASQSVGRVLLEQVAASLVALATTPLAVLAPILLYYDARIRKEGFDLEMLGRALAPPERSSLGAVG